MDPEAPAWEVCKENVKPMRKGRKVAGLSLSLAGAGASDVDREVDQWESAVAPATAEAEGDPLDVWVRYVAWLESSFPTDGDKAFLARERCCRVFRDDVRYREDARYVLGMWVEYCASLEEPEEAFRYAHKKELGRSLAGFWIAWAFSAELQNKPKTAADVFARGQACDARPQHLLEAKRVEFEARAQRKAAAAAAAPPKEPSTAPRRAPLAATKTTRSGAVPARRAQPAGAFAATAPPPSAVVGSGSGAGFAVFVDDEAPAPFAAAADDWPDFGTRASRTKENSLTPSLWTESALGARATPACASSSGIAIFDETIETPTIETTRPPPASPPRPATMRF